MTFDITQANVDKLIKDAQYEIIKHAENVFSKVIHVTEGEHVPYREDLPFITYHRGFASPHETFLDLKQLVGHIIILAKHALDSIFYQRKTSSAMLFIREEPVIIVKKDHKHFEGEFTMRCIAEKYTEEAA